MNNNSKVLALKYRPQTFDSLIGQEVMSETIINSIKADKVPNAYLFTGIRGIGKTTTARIVAKALNCLNGIDKLCEENFCENCEAIINSSHIDVMEIDAASNTGVDNVRELIEFSRYGPTSSRYKIFIIDEVHMLSKQAFNALLKTLEEPPEYLKFIFATTEIKKIPITVVSRCQRFDLSRIKSSELFEFIKKIKDKENGKVSDEALKLIVKISEGSVRDSLSLLDRGLLSLDEKTELDLNAAQKIFGYFDKSQLINLFELILRGEEEKVINIYRKIYNQGVEPKVFINDFLEISIEMFLIRLMHLSSIKINKNLDQVESKDILDNHNEQEEKKNNFEDNSKTVNQIKNIAQEEKQKPEVKPEIKAIDKNLINSFDDLLSVCTSKKEIKLKYELEKNVNLVKFERNRIEISFNDNLDKDFVKDLSSKLYEWTRERWIITFSKSKGEISVKEKQKNKKDELMKEVKSLEIYKKVMEKFPDAELIDVKLNEKKED
jgi:DNA polymerase-3 subunit gamma/tau